jgi:hypothetical protein
VTHILSWRPGNLEKGLSPPYKTTDKEGNTTMKRLLLIALMAGGLTFVPVQRSDAQVSVGIGVGYPAYRYSYYAILVTDTAITRTGTTDPIGTTATTTGALITTSTGTTATIGTITTIIATNLK